MGVVAALILRVTSGRIVEFFDSTSPPWLIGSLFRIDLMKLRGSFPEPREYMPPLQLTAGRSFQILLIRAYELSLCCSGGKSLVISFRFMSSREAMFQIWEMN